MLPLELSDLRGVKTFAQQALEKLGQDKVDYLLLNAAITDSAEKPGPHGSQWCEAYVVNHLCEYTTVPRRSGGQGGAGHVTDKRLAYAAQHYLTHLLREKLIASKSRIVVVSSGVIRTVKDTGVDSPLLALPSFTAS